MNIVKYNLFPGGVHHCITLSYDDGNVADIRLTEILRKHRLKGTFHLNSGILGNPDTVSANQIPEIYRTHEVSCHMVNHPFPTDIPDISMLEELIEDRRTLETACGYVVRGMSYPYGNYNSHVIDLCRTAGIEYSRTTLSTGGYTLPQDFLAWHPTCHHTNNLMDRLTHLYDYDKYARMRLLYVWGHSYEFDRSNNWEIIEEFAEAAADREDTWYATNIEIVDYIAALKSLRVSTDRTIIYNPSAIDVWVTVNNQTVHIKSGDTFRL